MYAELNRMLATGVIKTNQSSWTNPVMLVRKGIKIRNCLDVRKLNSLTVEDAFPLLHIEGLLSRLGHMHYISNVHLKDHFWQIPLYIQSRKKLYLQYRRYHHFTFIRYAFRNVAQTLCRPMDKVIPSALREQVFVYLDDLLIVTPNYQAYIQILERVSDMFFNAKLTKNLEKPKFCFRELQYLGYIVGQCNLSTDPAKIFSITEFSYPKTRRQVRGFMETTGW